MLGIFPFYFLVSFQPRHCMQQEKPTLKNESAKSTSLKMGQKEEH